MAPGVDTFLAVAGVMDPVGAPMRGVDEQVRGQIIAELTDYKRMVSLTCLVKMTREASWASAAGVLDALRSELEHPNTYSSCEFWTERHRYSLRVDGPAGKERYRYIKSRRLKADYEFDDRFMSSSPHPLKITHGAPFEVLWPTKVKPAGVRSVKIRATESRLEPFYWVDSTGIEVAKVIAYADHFSYRILLATNPQMPWWPAQVEKVIGSTTS